MTTSQGQLLTLGFIIATTVIVVAYDVAIIQACGAEASISRVVRHGINRYPILLITMVFGFGMLVGHVWLPGVCTE